MWLRGYTLVELLVVIAIMSLVAIIAVPAAGSVIRSMTLRSQAGIVAERLYKLRNDAVQAQQTITVLQSKAGLATSQGKMIYDTDILSVSVPEPFTYYPDGTTDGGRVVLYNGFSRVPVEVTWLTGYITIGH